MPKDTPSPRPDFLEESARFASEPPEPPLKTTAEIGRDGRIVIPAAMRAAMGIKEGSKLVLLMSGETLEVFTVEAGVRRAQEWVKRNVPSGVDLVEELFKERRAWAEEENG